MGRKKAPKNNIFQQTGDAASLVLQAVQAASAAFPPLQSAAGGALYIANLIRNFRSDTKDWMEFSDYVQNQVGDVIRGLPENYQAREDIKDNIRRLSSTLERIGKEIEEMQAKSTGSRLLTFSANPDKIGNMKRHLDEAINLLTLGIAVATGTDVAKIATNQGKIAFEDQQGRAIASKQIEQCMEMIRSTITASALPYDTTAGWDDTKICLRGTRRAHIKTVMDWVHAKDIRGTKQIFLLADVVGSGKTALAHTIAEQCSHDGVLASAFFFEAKAGRGNPRAFVFNLARDLANRIPEVSDNISRTLQKDPNLILSMPVSRLFNTLIFEPLVQCDIVGPLVVVIDAVNEAATAELQKILGTQIPSLPGIVRVFVTSRPEWSILWDLGPTITPVDLGIHESANHEDMAIYVDIKLKEIASYHCLEDWPSPELTLQFLSRAEGLFIWVATICEYLLQACYPDRMLDRLLETMRETQLPPEKKMDALYFTLLEACNWDDIDFVDGYSQVMGVMVIQRKPLTVGALQQLHGPMPRVRAIVLPLASLITGSTSDHQPVQILHSSFREYVTQRAIGHHRIVAKLHQMRLIALCLGILNTVFSVDIPGCGYLNSRESAGIPDVELNLTEEQWYAAEFWCAHLVQVVNPTEDVITALHQFLSLHLTTWIEVMVSKRMYKSLIPVCEWLETDSSDLLEYITNEEVYRSLLRLPEHLTKDGRHVEALIVIEDLQDINRKQREEAAIPDLQPVSRSSDESEDDSS
ncbi:hypothetical protein B0H19DRAFT_1268300 [Mycena capillaripes]|nr:hypothetical protein B0H19DRAFT_1268300 [Mycena capillaripes]